MPVVARIPIPTIVSQHVEEAAALRELRGRLVYAPHVDLLHLGRLDERLTAHLDGIAVAGAYGIDLAVAALESAGAGEVFTAAVCAVEARNSALLDCVCDVAGTSVSASAGLTSALGWLPPQSLRGTVDGMLGHADPFRRAVAIAACAMHRVDPGAVLIASCASDDARLRARALRVAGQIGRRDLLTPCIAHLGDDDPLCAFWAAASATLLGDRGAALEALGRIGLVPGELQRPALHLLLKVLNGQDAHGLLQSLARDAANVRVLIEGAGIAGDPSYIPWLISQMAVAELARVAGEAFSAITGTDLTVQMLDQGQPEDVHGEPDDDPDDDRVELDADVGLPWPDPSKVQAWWAKHGDRFKPGMRYFTGSVPERAHCLATLSSGRQRERIAAAQYLCLMSPGVPLFNTSAPVPRQRRLLAQSG